MKQYRFLSVALFLFLYSTAAAACAQMPPSAGVAAGDIVAVCNKGSVCGQGDADDVTLYFQTEGKAAIAACKVAALFFAVVSGSLFAIKACRKKERSTVTALGCRDTAI